MDDIVQMAEAHLKNVSQELEKLEAQKLQFQEQIKNLTTYLENGVATLEKYRSEKAESASTSQSTSLFK
jgi:sensor histidine kinase YesM